MPHSRTITAAIYYALANAAIAQRGRSSEHEEPKLYCLASIDRAKRRAYLMVINTSADETLLASIAGSGKQLDRGDLDAVVRLNSVSLPAVNTGEEPDNISLTRQDPPGIMNGSFQWEFPPATVTSSVYRIQ